MFGESKKSVICQLLTLKKELELNQDEAYLWYEIVAKVSYNAEENYILSKALYLLMDDILLYDYQEINHLIQTVENINC